MEDDKPLIKAQIDLTKSKSIALNCTSALLIVVIILIIMFIVVMICAVVMESRKA